MDGGTGIFDARLHVSGPGAFGVLSLEAGTHKVEVISPTNQRPATGRVAIAVYAEPREESVKIQDSELKISTLRSGGPGGQNVNKTESGVRIQHTPSGIQVVSTVHASQYANRKAALRVLAAKLEALENESNGAARSSARHEHGAGTERTAYIRSWDFIRGEVKDARTGQVARIERVLREGPAAHFHQQLIDQILENGD